MGFDKHLFISYAHLDDETATDDERGWVTQFHRYLETFLSQNLGEEARIWRDDRLRGLDLFADEIESQLPQTAALICVLTPRYLKSDWCSREVAAFCTAAGGPEALAVGNRSRVLKVLRLPVELDEQPPLLRQVLGYEFFARDGSHALPLDPGFGKEFAEAYRRKIYVLAQDVAELLEELGGAPDPAPFAGRPVVYLAEGAYDRREDREKVGAELRAHGYALLPEGRLPDQEAEVVAEVDRLLGRCDLAVHLVGSAYGAVPDGPGGRSLAVIQGEVAARHSRERGLPRVIWVPEGTRSEQPQQQAFLDALHFESDAQAGADLITGDLETLKIALHAALRSVEEAAARVRPAATTTAIGAPSPLVYLVCDRLDREAALPLVKHLRQGGLEVKLPTFSGDAGQVREANTALLVDCDAVLLFWGAGDETWKLHQENELRKCLSARGKPLRAAFTYLAAPESEDKAFLLAAEEPHLIDARAGFSGEALRPFEEALASAARGAVA